MSFNDTVVKAKQWICTTAHEAADKITYGVNWYNHKVEEFTDRIAPSHPHLARISKLFLQALPWAVMGIAVDIASGFPLTACVALAVAVSGLSPRAKTTALTVMGLSLVARMFCSHPALFPFFLAAGAFTLYTAFRQDEKRTVNGFSAV